MKVLLISLSENIHMRGVERYAYETAKSLSENAPGIELTMLVGSWQEYYSCLNKHNIKLLVAECKNSKISRHFYLLSKIKKLSSKYDVIHYLNTLPYFFINNAVTIMTIHDIAEYFVPTKYSKIQLLYRKLILKIATRNVNHIVTVSEFSKDAIVNKLSIPKQKVSVTYNGIEHFKSPGNFPESATSDYILFFGVLERTKGAKLTVNAFKRIGLEFPSLELVLVGKKGNEFEDIKSDIYNNNKIKYYGHVSDNKLKGIIKNARCVVFPSQYEGFGLPALEAFVYNDNVITSNNTALGEISKEFAVQINPYSIDELIIALKIILVAPKVVTKTGRNKIIKKFSWTSSSRILFDLYVEKMK